MHCKASPSPSSASLHVLRATLLLPVWSCLNQALSMLPASSLSCQAPAPVQAVLDPVSPLSLVSGQPSPAAYVPCLHAQASDRFCACTGSSKSISVLRWQPQTRSCLLHWSSDLVFRSVTGLCEQSTALIHWPSGPEGNEPLALESCPQVSVAVAGGVSWGLTNHKPSVAPPDCTPCWLARSY